ncbi:MAG: SocA family protein [Candidatus Aenigmarchaeota archaeon]|nr:SocA family protein [Candidatus Aenigmarchaeota archaeon]
MVNRTKYKEIILYLANKVNNRTLGKVKLMKLLYYLDFDFFEKYGKSVTGDQYLRWPLGPVPRIAEEVLEEMKKEVMVKIVKEKMPVGYNDKNLIVPLKEKTIKNISKEEIQMLDEIADKWEKHTGSEMTSASHGEAPWIATKPNEVIDYNLVYYRNKYNEMEKI